MEVFVPIKHREDLHKCSRTNSNDKLREQFTSFLTYEDNVQRTCRSKAVHVNYQ